MDWDQMATVGRVVRPHGNKGQVVVAPETDFAVDRFRVGAGLHVSRGDRVEALSVTASREQAGRWIVGFAGVETIDDAETLRGCDLRIPADQLRPLADGAWYLHDLVGCQVSTADGRPIGTVARVDVNAGLAMLVVTAAGDDQGADDEEILVPFTGGICPRVDVAAKRIEVDLPEGLLDLNRRGSGST